METRLVAKKEDCFVKPGILEKLMEESRSNKDKKFILVREKKLNKKPKEKIKRVKTRIRKAIELVKAYAKYDLSITRDLSFDEVISLWRATKSESKKYLSVNSLTAFVWCLSILGSFIISPFMLLGLLINPVLAVLVWGFPEEEKVSELIFLAFLYTALNPLALIVDGYKGAGSWQLSSLDIDDKTEEYKELVKDVFDE